MNRITLESVVLEVISGGTSPSRTAVFDPAYYYTTPTTRREALPTASASSALPTRSSQRQWYGEEEEEDYLDGVGPSRGIGGGGSGGAGPVSTWEEREREFRRSRPSLFLLLIAVGNLIVVHSELVCYAILIINHMRSANVLSLVYPLMVFLWGMLSVPRPTKTFWISLITYTEVCTQSSALNLCYYLYFATLLLPARNHRQVYLPISLY